MAKTKTTATRKKAMIEAMTSTLGIVSQATKQVGISRETHYAWIREDIDYKKAIDEVIETLLDYAEHQLHNLIKAKNPAAIFFFLKSKGKDRGYGFQKEDEITEDVADKVIISLPDNNRMKQVTFDMDKSGKAK